MVYYVASLPPSMQGVKARAAPPSAAHAAAHAAALSAAALAAASALPSRPEV